MNFGEPKTGQTFSHYRLLSKLGEGGMGVVYAAEDTHLGRQVAVKFLLAGRHGRLSRARFLREARSASVLNHPNIATIYDYGKTDEGCPFIVMELLRGQTLSELISAGGLTTEQSVSIIRDVLRALGEAHEHSIVHRDVKPSNIVMGDRGQVKVLDFGLAKSFGEQAAGGPRASAEKLGLDAAAALPTQTLAGAVLGTPLYVSPEQATGELVDQRSDLFSVGTVLYECLARRPAFAAPSMVEIFAQIISPAQPPPPSSFNPAVTPELDRVTLKALSKSPDGRYQSADEFLDALARVPTAPPVSVPAEQRVFGFSLEMLYRRIISRGSGIRNILHARKDLHDGADSRDGSRHAKAARRMLLGAALLALLLFGGRSYWRAEALDSIAVLPFVNEGREESLEYLSEGLTDTLTRSLSRLPGLRVISRNSVARYKGHDLDPKVVGSELKVRAVLTGLIRADGGELRVAVDLIDTRDGSIILSERYTKKSSELLSLQDDIVRTVARKLDKQQGAEGKSLLSNGRQVNPAAYDLYVKGRWYWNKRTGEGALQAIQHFQQAIDLDPGFGLPYAGLADTYALNTWVKPGESHVRATAAALKALELDDTLGEAHATLGFIKARYERDWADADREFKRAIELSPNHATAHHWYADYLLALGRFEEANQELKRAQELDPLSPIINADVGLYFFYTRQYDRAINHYVRMEELFPNFYPTNMYLGWAYTQKGMHREAAEQFQKALKLSNGHSLAWALLGYTYAVSGQRAQAQEVLKQLEAMTATQNVAPYRFALVYTGLGENERALQWLNRAYDERDILLMHINVTPFFDPLRQDPGFQELLRRMELAA